jgi:hypothetical protein
LLYFKELMLVLNGPSALQFSNLTGADIKKTAF